MLNIIIFILLLVASLGAKRILNISKLSPTGSGAIVMSVGIFSTFALTRLPMYSDEVGNIALITVFVLWITLASSFLESYMSKKFYQHTNSLLKRFTLGTWVAASAVLATLASRVSSENNFFIYMVATIAILTYIPYVIVFITGYVKLWKNPKKHHITGTILLSTVATQSIIIMLHAVIGNNFGTIAAISLVVFDLIFLFSGMLLIANNYYNMDLNKLANQWSNTNCIIHGAVSILGLALVTSSNFSVQTILIVWTIAFTLFIFVESIELIRMIERYRRYGLKKGILTYDVSQWSRNFTFGMFYAFSFSLETSMHNIQFTLSPILSAVYNYGQYIVVTFLLIEIFIFLYNQIGKPSFLSNKAIK